MRKVVIALCLIVPALAIAQVIRTSDGVAVSTSNPLPILLTICGSVARNSESGSTTSFELTAATTDRITFTIHNNSTTSCYCLRSTSDAVAGTADGYDIAIGAGGYYEEPYGISYQGELNCECDATDGFLEYWECIR